MKRASYFYITDSHKGLYYFQYVPVTETVHHDAVNEDQTIIDKEAWDEYLYTECTTCGARQ